MAEGWIKLHRSLIDHELWNRKPFSWGQAWADMIMLANREQGTIWPRGIETTVNRGQLGWSQTKIASRWGWSRGAVQDFYKWLEKQHQIQQQNNNASSIVTIVNYDKFQDQQQQKQQHSSSTAAAQQQHSSTNKNSKNTKKEKKEKNSNSPTPLLLEISNSLSSPQFLKVWPQWIEFRLSLKQPKNPEAMFERQLAFLEPFGSDVAVQILQQSLRNEWQGLFELKHASRSGSGSDRKTERTIAAVKQLQEAADAAERKRRG